MCYYASLEMDVVILDQMILDELENVALNGVTVLSVVTELNTMRVVFETSSVKIVFMVDDDYQFQTLSVTCDGVTHEAPNDLTTFDDLVFDVMTKVKLVEMRKRIEYEGLAPSIEAPTQVQGPLDQARLEAVMRREEKIKQQEHQLNLREQKIKKIEKLLYAKEAENTLKRREEEMELEAKRLKNREKIERTIKKNVNDLLQKFKKQR